VRKENIIVPYSGIFSQAQNFTKMTAVVTLEYVLNFALHTATDYAFMCHASQLFTFQEFMTQLPTSFRHGIPSGIAFLQTWHSVIFCSSDGERLPSL